MYRIDVAANTELMDVVRLFYGDGMPELVFSCDGDSCVTELGGNTYTFAAADPAYAIIPAEHRDGRLSKIALYDALSAYTGRKMPWGALTGVRPTKLFYECLKNGMTDGQATDIMQRVYRVELSRACILRRIVYAQRGKVSFSPEYINLYVHVPYCTSRCSYCSFVSAPIGKCVEQSKRYVELLVDEIARSRELISAYGRRVLSVYIGGGTPTALAAPELDRLLAALDGFDVEYTCEAGRPDTIDGEKADILRAHGVTRVCVNPQTLCDATLEKIGRRHTASDFFDAYDTVRSRGFEINCDLIAGLADETADDFMKSFEGIKSLNPENITVHSLSKKNGSGIRYDDGSNPAAPQMTEYALSHIGDYRPYYLYRQKRQSGNLENIGFSLPGRECINNITTMEETVGVMACGSGAISKYVGDGEIKRFANLRDTGLYILQYDERIKAKLDFFGSLFRGVR